MLFSYNIDWSTTPIPFTPVDGVEATRIQVYKFGKVVYVSIYLEIQKPISTSSFDLKLGELSAAPEKTWELAFVGNAINQVSRTVIGATGSLVLVMRDKNATIEVGAAGISGAFLVG